MQKVKGYFNTIAVTMRYPHTMITPSQEFNAAIHRVQTFFRLSNTVVETLPRKILLIEIVTIRLRQLKKHAHVVNVSPTM
jgi:hypothetical protein